MPKPPPTPPHSDIEGVHRDKRRNTDVTADRGESAREIAEAKRKSVGRPDHSEPAASHDNPYTD